MGEHMNGTEREGGAVPAPGQRVSAIEARLRGLRTRARWLLVGIAAAILLSCAIAATLALGFADYLLRLPFWFRQILWIGGVGLLAYEAWQRLRPALAFRPTLTDVALRLERTEEGQRAGLPGVLASGLELAREPSAGATRWLADHVVDDAAARFRSVRATSLIRPNRAGQSFGTLAVCIASVLLLSVILGPTLTAIGAVRVLAPWSGVQWPKRTVVADATGLSVHPINTALPLRAALERTDHATGQTKVWAVYRIVGERGSPRRVQLTAQNRVVDVAEARNTRAGGKGELYERLIEPASLGISGGTATAASSTPAAPTELEYWFETADDQTDPARVKLVQPPSVVSAAAKITPPAYVQSSQGRATFVAGSLDLGPGNDQRAIVGPVLAGSHVELAIRLNKAVPTPSVRHDDAANEARHAWVAAAFPGADFGPPDELAISFDGAQWTLGWTASRSLRLPITPTDEFGLRGAEESTFAIDVAADRPPTATVLEPREDESVLPTAIIPVTGEGRDDVGLTSLSLSRQVARPAKGSIGAAPEPAGGSETILSRDLPEAGASAESTTQSTLSTELELTPLDLKPGEELWLTAVATDNYEFAGQRHEPVRSAPRRLRIIKEEELVDQIRTELNAVRKVAIQLDSDQGELQKSVQKGAVSADDRRRQAAITQRSQQQSETVKRLNDRTQRNRLKDETIGGLLNDVDSLLKEAAASSEKASTQMESAARQSPEPERAELEKPQQDAIAKDQDAVRDNLSRLAEMLDKGEDSWVMSRTLQRLAQQQRDLQSQTQRAGDKTMGKKEQDLTPQEKSELAEITDRQQRLSDQARQTLDQLEQRAEQLKQTDKAQAEAMKQAAQRGREKQVPGKMEDAAKDVQQNQTSQATAQQQEAADALEQMLGDLQQSQKNRDAALRRTLADLLQSLEQLIQDQQAQINALAGAAPTAAYAGLDVPMIALNQNTLGVADKARSDKAMARVASLVDRAGKNQESAIAALRASPVAVDEAEQGEKESLRLLGLAKAEAQKLKDDAGKRDAQKKRQELRQIYREALEQQAAIKGDTDPFIGKQVDRRERIKIRGIGERQDTLRAKLADVKAKTEELAEAGVFEFAHQRLELATGTAAKKLKAGQPDRAVQRNQDSAMRVLSSLIAALDEQLKRDDEFRDTNSNGGGGSQPGGQQQPALPPLAELRLLRAMQDEAAQTTRAIDEAKEQVPEELAGLGELQRNLAKRGDELIKKMQKPTEGEVPGKPGDEPKDPDKPSPKPEGDGG
jgi:hypothetical protein